MKHFILTFAIVLIAISLQAKENEWNGEKEKYSKGIGTLNDPFLIEKPSHLAYLANGGTFKGKFFKVTTDIDLGSLPWTPIAPFEDVPFQGNIDFDFHVISNLYVDGTTRGAGLFGYIQNARISNIIFDESCHVKGNALTAMLAAYACDSELSQITINGQIQSIGLCPKTGGAIGYGINVSCNDILNHASVVHETQIESGKRDPLLSVGGIVGMADCVDITRCGNYGYVQAFDGQPLTICEVGGIIGSVSNPSSVAYCFNQGKIVGRLRYVRAGNDGTKSYVGGIVGGRDGAQIEGCYNTGQISGESYWSGNYACIMSCYDSSVNDNYHPLKNCYSTWDIVGCQAKSYTCNQEEFNGIKTSLEEINSDYLIDLMNNGTAYFIQDKYPYLNGSLPFFNTIKAIRMVTEDAEDIAATKAKLRGAAHFSGYELKKYLFRIKERTSKNWEVKETLNMSYDVDGLIPNTVYDVQFGVATTDEQEFWSDNIKEFKTNPIYSEAFTISVDKVNQESVIVNCAVVVDETEKLLSYGVSYKSIDNKETIVNGSNKVDEYYSVELKGLKPNTEYEVRAFAVLDIGVVHGDRIVFFTAESGSESIIGGNNISQKAYNIKGELVEDNYIKGKVLPKGVYIIVKEDISQKIIVR